MFLDDFLTALTRSSANLSDWEKSLLATLGANQGKTWSSKQVAHFKIIVDKYLPSLDWDLRSEWATGRETMVNRSGSYETPPKTHQYEYLGNFTFRIIPAPPFAEFKQIIDSFRGSSPRTVTFDPSTKKWIVRLSDQTSGAFKSFVREHAIQPLTQVDEDILHAIATKTERTKFTISDSTVNLMSCDPFVFHTMNDYRVGEFEFEIPKNHSDMMSLIRVMNAVKLPHGELYKFTNHTSAVPTMWLEGKLQHATERSVILVHKNLDSVVDFLAGLTPRLVGVEFVELSKHQNTLFVQQRLEAKTGTKFAHSNKPNPGVTSIACIIDDPKYNGFNQRLNDLYRATEVVDFFLKDGHRIICVNDRPSLFNALDQAIAHARFTPDYLRACDVIHI